MKEKIKEIYKAKETLDQLRKKRDKKIVEISGEKIGDLIEQGEQAIIALMFDVDTTQQHWSVYIDKKECEKKITAMFDWIEKANYKSDLDFFNSWCYGREQANVACVILDEIFNNGDIYFWVLNNAFIVNLLIRWVNFTFYSKENKAKVLFYIFKDGWKGFVDHWWGRNYRQMIYKENR